MAAELVAGGDERAALAYLECHSRLLWRKCAHGHDVLAPGSSCNRRICALCARRLAAEMVDDLERSLAALRRQGVFQRAPQQTLKWATFTLRARADLRKAVKEIGQAYRTLQRRVGWLRDRRDGLFGAAASIEIGRGRNVHLHVFYWGRWVAQATLSETWRQITGDSFIVHVARAEEAPGKALREVVKYVTDLSKPFPGNHSPDQEPAIAEARLAEVHFAFKGRRRILTYGVFYNVQGKEARAPLVCPVEACGQALRPPIGVFDPEHVPAALLYRYRYGVDPPDPVPIVVPTGRPPPPPQLELVA